MCGIIGYVGKRDCAPVLLEGLRRLEFRGYDSAGIALAKGGKIDIRRAKGKLVELEKLCAARPCHGSTGIGHTRWATHGRPSEENAHPHRSGPVAVVHNGIIENHSALRKELKARGHTFTSETDTEVVCHLIHQSMIEGLPFEEAVRAALAKLAGSYALAILCADRPDLLIAARKESALVLGLGNEEGEQGSGENFVASDIPAILPFTRSVVPLEEGEIACLTASGFRISTLDGRPIQRTPRRITWNPVMAEKGGHKHFMLKEILEQPRALTDTIRGRTDAEKSEVRFDSLGKLARAIASVERLAIVACGTSWHAALAGRYMIEDLARIPTDVDLASEFRYRDPLVGPSTLVVAISQSGETADTLAAVRLARAKGAKVLSVTNVVESTIVRESDGVIYTHAGPEIGVASTKAFTTQLAVLYLLAVHLATGVGRLKRAQAHDLLQELRRLPRLAEQTLAGREAVLALARKYAGARDFLYLGRGINYPIALEGALKLKEISYIHAEGYPAGEMKHGPIALIDEKVPIVGLATRNGSYDKILGNLSEVKARGGKVIALANEVDDELRERADDIILVPTTNPFLTALLLTLPLQLFAYYIADLRGSDVDQPRNLAKSVTVE